MPFTENNGVRIHWEEQGSGDPLLLIMGLGYSMEMWYRGLPEFAASYRTIRLDNRGVGQTDSPPGPYLIPDMAEDAATTLRAAGVTGRAHVFGISMGGMIAQELALAHPEMIRSLVLGCTACGGSEAVSADREVLETLAARGAMDPDQGIRAMVPYIYDASTPAVRIDADLEVRKRTYPKAESYFSQLGGIGLWRSCDRISAIKAPTLVIHGKTDRLVPPANGEVLARKIPGARLLLLDNASHIFPADQPEASMTAIMGFFKEVEGREVGNG